VTAVGATASRPIVARLTGFRYAPPPSGDRTIGTRDAPPDVRIAIARIEKRASEHVDASSEAGLGVAYAVAGSVDKAVVLLERATRIAPTVATIQSDLAAAYLERGDQLHRAEDFVCALNSSERAVRTDPSVTEAWFNRALALERLNLEDQARAAWRDYVVEHDGASRWTDEARAHQSNATRVALHPVSWERSRDEIINAPEPSRVVDGVKAFPQETRELFERIMLPAWADAALAHDDSMARTQLRRVHMLADALEHTTGDRLPTDAASALDSCAPHPSCAATAARGLRAFRAGREAYDRRLMTDADAQFVLARRELETARNPMQYWTDFYVAGSAFYAKRLTDAVDGARRLSPIAKARHYLNLQARAEWLLGVVPVMQSDFDGGIPHYRESERLFETTREVGNQVAILARLGQAYSDAGDLSSAWSYQARAFRIADSSTDRMAVGSLLLASVSFCLSNDLPEAALHFQKAAVENAAELPAAQRAEAGIQLARILSRLRRFDEAQRELLATGQTLDEAVYQDPARRGEFLLASGMSLAAQNPDRALAELSQALDLFRRAGLSARLPETYLQMGRVAATTGDNDAAISTLLKGLDEFERQRRSIGDRSARMLQSANAAEVVDELAGLYVSSHREWEALRTVERLRARTLVDGLEGSQADHALDLDAIRRSLPRDVAIVSYASLSDRLLIWALRRDTTAFAQRPIGRERLTELANRVSEEVSRPARETPDGPSSELFDAALRPLAVALAGTRTIVIVPAEPLQLVPFSALFDSRTKTYEVEQASILLAPSVAVFAHESERLTATNRRGPRSVVVVGDPFLSSANGGAVARALPGAESEARTVAALYRSSELLVGAAATKEAFVSALANADVVHFGGHAVSSAGAPERSRLLFAPGPPTDSGKADLDALEIARQHWPRPRVVALAACDTAAGRSFRGEGLFSLARAFMFAGVPSVVASLTAADDESTRRLFVIFHQHVAQGETPEQALRLAQLELLQQFGKGTEERWRWAPFVVIGGLSTFQLGH
jgi:CHAT domain-containing protein/Flp pilus assembly protein TadD